MGVSVSAFTTEHGVPGSAAPIVATASIGGRVSGWLYGLRRHRTPGASPARRGRRVPDGHGAAASLAPSPILLGAAVVITEVAIPPTLVLLNVLTEKAVGPAVLTQAFTWNNSAGAAGSALAALLAGHTAEALSASAAFALAPAAGLALLATDSTLPSG